MRALLLVLAFATSACITHAPHTHRAPEPAPKCAQTWDLFNTYGCKA